ncbi:hypothetical protein GCM10007415_22160 [Parapedobacter pyrenivorans]|uniref:Uncharacterized protein n=1 Tax=Parapedobacter pyrenivorans TaxID=1305674 RepID=A0A917HRF8_9SPHI|nr:hypothetical protein [Parapedobacter pyrenivorans]GGG87818.1 hypothetical protein GCM10007415_22160 [Parapedobacter pyrenivorans]
MKLIQVFVPLADNKGDHFPESYFNELRSAFKEKFGGVTIFKQMPVEGFWKDADENTEKDRLAIFEVMAEALDTAYWKQLKVQLEKKFSQRDLLIRHWNVKAI